MSAANQQGAPAAPKEGSLPVALWIGTGIFALLAAGALLIGMSFGRKAIEGSSAVEKEAVESQKFAAEAGHRSPARETQAR